jgi:glutathione S-transferase
LIRRRLLHDDRLSRRLNLEPDPVTYKELSDNFNATLDIYDRILGKQKYIAGNVSQHPVICLNMNISDCDGQQSLTLADLYHIPVAILLSYGNIDIASGRANVKRWLDEVSGRPSWQKAKEGLDT